MEEVKHEKCRRCKCWRAENLFLNDKGRRMKTCYNCRDGRRNILKITKRDMSKQLNEEEGLAIIMKVKEYYEDMKRERKEYVKQKITCECGSIHRIDGKASHIRTVKHQAYTESKIIRFKGEKHIDV